jgi:hypothetical protein
MSRYLHSNSTNTQTKVIIAVIITAVAVGGLFFFREGSTATVTVNPVNQTAQVYIDNQPAGRLSTDEPVSFQTSPGSKEVLVSGQNTYPWKATVTVSAGSSTTVSPFTLPEVSQQIKTAPESISKQIQAEKLNPSTSVMTPDGNKEVIVTEDGRLATRWQASTSSAPSFYSCSESSCQAVIYDNDSRPARQVGVYPGRSDVVIFSTSTGVYALEVNPEGETQNFQPITQEVVDPYFVTADDTVFVKSGSQVTATQL